MISVGRQLRTHTQKSKGRTVAAPVGGWNARDALGSMGKLDAVTLQNWFPSTDSVKLRKGYSAHATGLPAQVNTLMAYSSGSANTLFAASGTAVYDVTSAGAVGAASLSGLTHSKLQHVNFTTSGGTSYLMFVNGDDKLRSYDGSWHADGDGTHDITGFDTATAANITVFKNRIWLVQENRLKAWYLQINAIAGAANALDMSSIAKLGGYLMAAETWTLDAGYGVDDYLVFITSNGEVLVWRLTDPTSPSGIALIGVWRIGAPIGRRCFLKYGGDLLVITREGVVPLSARLQATGGGPKSSITDKIQDAMNTAVTNYSGNFGWQLLMFPGANQLYLNVPIAVGDMQQQYVMNTITKAWCNFTGWDANCWELFNDEPYFGGNGVVNLAWDGEDDNGSNINGVALQSFQAYGGARQKHCKMVRFHTHVNGTAAIYGNVNVDYDTSDSSAELSFSPTSVGLWDVGLWDEALWGSGLVPSAEWQGATGIGYTFAPFLKTASNSLEVEWTATDMIFEAGGAL